MEVEIKVNFTGDEIDKAKKVFELDPEKADERDIYFGEILTGRDGRTALPLLKRGVILRVRATKAKKGDVTVKLRGPDGCIDAAQWPTWPATDTLEAKIEGDWADRRLVSASLTADSDGAGRQDFAAGTPLIKDLMSEEQKGLARRLLIPFGDVTLLPPISARKWKHENDGDVDAEEWKVDGKHFLEISVVAEEGEDPEQKLAELLRRVEQGGLTVAQDRRPKTTLILEHLTAQAG